MLDEPGESRRSVAFPLLSLSFFCLLLPFLCLPSQLGFLEEKRFVVWRATSIHRYRKIRDGKDGKLQGSVGDQTVPSHGQLSGPSVEVLIRHPRTALWVRSPGPLL
ncbi:uncharacterized protein AKAW2_50619A [Aspergillus luchuensis]|uniref:Uncharacterized protein n=1 Tax=Aspergillus kawachii TaxID=1069201 RepID=A0A7R8A0Z3_ASPKA|nr:uncharacterized protein AKAW2_50619A [Aspergillus luchuensis]BCS00278.1 hypothetical protein AKAW2_50619A [Aspergillus luchuensis]BCS12061.1 hypothetical protein ALUC_50107S [Aspergillus luchuensis]